MGWEGKIGIGAHMQGRVEPFGAATLNIKKPWHPLGMIGVATSEKHATEKRARSLGLLPYFSDRQGRHPTMRHPPSVSRTDMTIGNNRARAIGIDNGEGHPIPGNIPRGSRRNPLLSKLTVDLLRN